MERITRRIGESVEFVDGKGYANLSHEEAIKLLFETLAECEDKLEKKSLMLAYLKIVDFLCGVENDKPLEIKAAMIWGALLVLHYHEDLSSCQMSSMLGSFMSKQMNLI